MIGRPTPASSALSLPTPIAGGRSRVVLRPVWIGPLPGSARSLLRSGPAHSSRSLQRHPSSRSAFVYLSARVALGTEQMRPTVGPACSRCKGRQQAGGLVVVHAKCAGQEVSASGRLSLVPAGLSKGDRSGCAAVSVACGVGPSVRARQEHRTRRMAGRAGWCCLVKRPSYTRADSQALTERPCSVLGERARTRIGAATAEVLDGADHRRSWFLAETLMARAPGGSIGRLERVCRWASATKTCRSGPS